MIKSPCKNCELHKSMFPKCLDNCEIIKDLQKLSLNRYKDQDTVNTNLDYQSTRNLSLSRSIIKKII